MPRPERVLDPTAGPVQEFAAALRELRRRAGNPGYRTLANTAGYSPTTLSDAAGGRRLPAWQVAKAYITACGENPDLWHERWLDAAAKGRARSGPDAPAPYQGLMAFTEGEADRFFGRGAAIADLLDRLSRHRLLVLFGPSGSGKSSLLHAGLVPALTASAPTLSIVRFTPGSEPDSAIASATGDLADGAVVMIDQFEEVFTLCSDDAERARFIGAVLALSADDRATRVVLAIRADFYAACAAHPDLVAAMTDRNVLVGPLSDDELREAITGPAAQVGASVERALTAKVLADAHGQPGALPLVSHALLETWRQRQGDILTLAGYEAIGGLRGAVARTAELVYDGLDPQQQRTVRHLVLRLTTVEQDIEDTRRRVRRTALDLPGVDTVIDRLVTARLLVVTDDVVEVAHEALIRAWPRLREWLSHDREALRAQRRLCDAAESWAAGDRDPDLLYRGSRLVAAAEWADSAPWREALTPLEREFLAVSRAAQAESHAAQRRRVRNLRLLAGTLTVLLVLALTATAVAAWQWRTASQQRQEGLSRQYAAQAMNALHTDVETAVRYAVDGYRTAPTREARSALLSVAGARPYSGRLQHGGMVKDVVFSPDGSALATAGQDGTIAIWDRATRLRRSLFTAPGRSAVRSVAYAPDGRTLVSGGLDGSILVWDTETGQLTRRLRGGAGQHTTIDSVAVSTDGTIAALGEERRVLLWSADGTPLGELGPHGGLQTEVSFSPDGRLLISAGDDGRAVVWDLASRAQVRTVDPRMDALFAVTFSPDGSRFATTGQRGDITIWNTATGTLEATLRGRGGSIRCLAFAPDGSALLATGNDGTVAVWDVTKRALRTRLSGGTSGMYGVAVSRDGATVAAAGRDRAVFLWDREAMPMAGHTGEANALTVAPDGRTVLSAGLDGVGQWWAVDTRRPLRTIKATDRAVDAALAGDGRTAVIGGSDGSLRLWDVTTGTMTRELPRQPDVVASLDMRTDGTMIVTGSADWTVKLWDTVTGTATDVVRHPHHLVSAMFTPDGTRTVSASQDGTVVVWDIAERRELLRLRDEGGAARAGIDPSGRLLAVGRQDGRTSLWDLTSGAQLGHVNGHVGPVAGVAFSPDGRTLATGGLDGTIHLWTVADRSVLATLTGAGGGIGDLAWNPDGRTLYSASTNNLVRSWPVRADEVARQLCTELTRHFGVGKPTGCATGKERRPTRASS